MQPEQPESSQDSPVDTSQHPPLHLDPMQPAKSRKTYLFIPGFVLLLGVLGFGAYMLGSKKPADKPAATVSQQPAAASTEKDVPDASDTKAYENGFLGVKLTYPSNWTATEDENKGSVRLESPNFSYPSSSKGTVTGNFRVYIRQGARDVDSKYIGRGYAMQPSEKLVYAKPAPGQRADTNLSLFGLDTPDNFAFFMIAGNFNLQRGDTLGPNYGKEQGTFIIAGGFSAKDVKEDLATNPVSADLVKTSNAYKQALDILKSLQLR